MRWFGPNWGAPICDEVEEAPAPLGHVCPQCEDPIRVGQPGFLVPHYAETPGESAYHLECLLAAMGIPNEPACRPGPENCPNHPPASSLRTVACALCGAFKIGATHV